MKHFLMALTIALSVSQFALAAAQLPPDITVALDGSCDFKTITEALNSIPRDNKERKIILIKDGVYPGRVTVNAPFVTLRGQSRKGVKIQYGQGATSVLNVNATDLVVENLSIINTVGQVGPHEVAISGRVCDRTVLIDSDILSKGADTISLWQNDGRYYHARLNVTGSVDFICPHGWCYMTDSTITQLNPAAEAAVWHDGQYRKDMKFVIRNCRFDGPDNWFLARHHHDALFYFLDCSFSKVMRDKAPYRVLYPLDGGTPTEADIKNNKDHDPSNIWGERAYYFNSHREGGDYAWLKNNLEQAPGAPKPADITAKWTFGGTWDPEDATGPKISSIDLAEGKLNVKFGENVTVKGKPAVKLAGGASAAYESGSGSDTLLFAAPTKANVASIDLNGGAIIATNAAATIRNADLKLP